jgi:hypothetical protein
MATISSKHLEKYSHRALYIAWDRWADVATSVLLNACALADVIANEQGTYGVMHDRSRVILMWIGKTVNEDSLQYVPVSYFFVS